MRRSALVLLSSMSIAASAAAAASPDDSSVISTAAFKARTTPVDPEIVARLVNVDSFLSGSHSRNLPIPSADFGGRHQSAQFDPTLGVPTFLWAKRDAAPIAVGALGSTKALLTESAKSYLRTEASTLKLTDAMINSAEISDVGYNGHGPAVVRLRQRVNGLPVYHRSINVLLDRDNKPVATSGYFANGYSQPSTTFALSSAQAVSKAWAALGGVVNPLTLVLHSTVGEYQSFSLNTPLAGSHSFERDPRSRKMYYASADGSLQPAYYVELFAKARSNGALSAYALMVSASSGAVLHRENLTASEAAVPFTYRMFADTTPPYQVFDEPLGNGYTPFTGVSPSDTIVRTPSPALPNLVTLSSGPISTQDPWLADTATTTLGNNVDACLDLNDTAADGIISTPLNTCDPMLGDERGATSSAHTFDYIATPDADPSTDAARGGAVVSLFYLNNWLHDWWYDHGFNEASGNAQTVNYGRGGVEGDPIKAQGQDGSGRNNANMSTPADGSSPTMQQYLFDGPITGEVRQLTPTNSGKLKFTGASFGPATFDVTAQVVLAADGSGTSPTDGCGPVIPDPLGLGLIPTTPAPPQVTPSLIGKIVLIDRGTCAFTNKAAFALSSGAAAMVVVTNNDVDPITMGNGDIPIDVGASPTDMIYQIPSVQIRRDAGAAIKAAIAAGTTTMHVQRVASIDLDGTLDNQVVGHEFFHYVHHRLTDSSNQQANAMSEGWGDTNAMMISVRDSDRSAPNNDHYQGAYGLAGYVIDNFYNGIRRAPYSTNHTINAFTLKHIADGTPTPDGGPGTSNSEVHSAGEIWANEMWNCYAGILNEPGLPFVTARSRMKDYIIGGFKMTPTDATFTEARDAVLAVVKAANLLDYAACSEGFRSVGSGKLAVSPARDSTDLTGVVEDYTPFIDLLPAAFTFRKQETTIREVRTSETVTISGLSEPAPISVSGNTAGLYSKNGGAFTKNPGLIANGDTLAVRLTSSKDVGNEIQLKVSVGTYTTRFSVTTVEDNRPDRFTFTDITAAPLNMVLGAFVVPTGYNVPVAADVTGPGCTIRIETNGDGDGHSDKVTSGTVNPGQKVTVLVRSSKKAATTLNCIVTIGGVRDNWAVTTQP